MSRKRTEALLDRYLKGEATEKESVQVEQWLEEKGTPYAEWQQLDPAVKAQWLSGVFDEIKNTIHAQDVKVVQLLQRKPWSWRSIAAAAAVLAISGALYLYWPLLQSKLHPVQLTTLHVPEKQKKQISLADGSLVWVNEGSALKYPKTFNGNLREVYLSGEAYFDIVHDVSRPFVIHTGNVVTTVLGTCFNIREDKNTHIIEVTVTRGKVSVANGSKLLGIIMPNQQIKFNTLKSEIIQGSVNVNAVIAWQQSALHFDDISFADAALKLEQHFNVKISFRNEKVKNCRFTGTSLNGDKLDKILKVICAFNNATYETKPDGSIMIDGPGCN